MVRTTIEVDVVGSSPARDYFLFFLRAESARKKSASWSNPMQIDGHQKMKAGMLDPMRDTNKGTFTGGGDRKTPVTTRTSPEEVR